jgi:hypothetical protein
MSVTFEDIRHDGGTHRVEVEIEGDQCVIRFGASFTLRVNEANLNTLREMIHDAVRDMAIERRDTSGACSSKAWAWEASDQEVNSESEMIHHGIDAREKKKAQAAALDANWNPNDPANW